MSGETGGEGERSSRARTYTTIATVAFALVVCALAVGLSSSALAQEGDTSPPEFANATKGNLTTIEVTITDDTDVDERTISASDFTLSSGSIREVAVNETGNSSHVQIRLTDVVATNNVTVSIADGARIKDVAGNNLTSGSAVVTGMDGYRPQLQNFRVSRINESTAKIRIVASEPLSELYVGVGGPGSDTLTMANFTEIDTPAAYKHPYEANVTFESDGEFDVLVGTMVDESGVQSRYNVVETILVDRTPPSATIGAPASTDVGDTVSLSAERSTDEYGIDRYRWSIDGNATAAGATTEHTFQTPGYHEVTLTVWDRRNNSDSTTFPILVDSAATTTDVSVTASNGTATTASVGPNRSVGRVLIEHNGSLVSTADVRLDSLTVDVPVNTSASVTVSARSNVSAWFDTANTTALAGLAVEHERSLPTATFRFSINRSRLTAAGIAPDDVTLYRETDGWRSVYTTKIDESDGWVTYEATAGGLSRFVVGAAGGSTVDETSGANESSGTATNETAGSASTNETSTGAESEGETGSPRILVANSTLLTDSIDPGDRAIVRAIAHNDGNSTGSYVVGLVVNNSVVTTTTVTVPPGENRTVTFAEPLADGGSVVVNGTLAGGVSVGTNGSAAAATSSGGLPIPNPLALWPGGLFGRLLGAVFWFVVVLYAVLKALAIYLGY